MTERRAELVRTAARLFAERGYHGTSMGDIADAMGIQKASLYSLTESKQQLLYDTVRSGAEAFHTALDAVDDDAHAVERIREALRGHLRVVAEQLDAATVFTREWRYLEGGFRDEFVAERRRYEERWRDLFREGVERGELRMDLRAQDAALLVLSAANWAYTWLPEGTDTDGLADRFTAIVVDGIGGYSTPRSTNAP
jgi:AcrR family transcriptional regulator